MRDLILCIILAVPPQPVPTGETGEDLAAKVQALKDEGNVTPDCPTGWSRDHCVRMSPWGVENKSLSIQTGLGWGFTVAFGAALLGTGMKTYLLRKKVLDHEGGSVDYDLPPGKGYTVANVTLSIVGLAALLLAIGASVRRARHHGVPDRLRVQWRP